MKVLPMKEVPSKSKLTREYQYRLLYYIVMYGKEARVSEVIAQEKAQEQVSH